MARQKEFLDHLLECPHCGTIRLRIPKDADGSTIIRCSDCNRLIGFRFNIEGQGRIHVALPVEMWGVFVNELVALMNVAGERFATAFGEPGGNA